MHPELPHSDNAEEEESKRENDFIVNLITKLQKQFTNKQLQGEVM